MNPVHKTIYEFIVSYILDHQYPPSIREILDATGYYSTSTIHRYLHEMYELGILETDAGVGQSRAIRVPGLMVVRREEWA